MSVNLKDRIIILIGGAGFIGHNLAVKLHSLGAQVTIIDPMSINNYYSVWLSKDSNREMYLGFLMQRQRLLDSLKIKTIHVDACDYEFLNMVMKPLEPETVIHLAAVAHIDRSNAYPYKAFKSCLTSLCSTLDVCRALGVDHTIFLSSSTAYGDFPNPVLNEDDSCSPKGVYGTLKFMGEWMVNYYRDTFDMDLTVVRPCALYGPRCISGRVIQKFIEAALTGAPITIQGTGEDKEDFTYIEDFLEGMVRVIENENSRGELFNLTSGNARSIKDVADIVNQHLPTEITYTARDNQKPSRGTMSVQKAKDLIGYWPTYDLESGVKEYIDWYGEMK